ncbi:MAG: diadenylate cyclase CdaA [Oscillospiraceae bacterium]|nr:diadenylate cyclase CdaA [Oscillospiraceae bacterium]
MGEFFSSIWSYLVTFFGSIDILPNVLDILLVAFAIYSLVKLVRDSRAEQLIKGIVILAVCFLVASPSLLDLKALYFLLKTVFDNGLLVLVIIFQPEIRRALEHAGHSRIGRGLFNISDSPENREKIWQNCIAAVCGAVETLQNQRMGALIVIERETKLGEIANTGTVLDAAVTSALVANIFFNNAPLHDGAMIIRDGRIYAAGCILPLSELQLHQSLGTRHRAALGMSENSDAMVVAISEESGIISLASGGELKRRFSMEALRVALEHGILYEGTSQPDRKRRRKRKNGEPGIPEETKKKKRRVRKGKDIQ